MGSGVSSIDNTTTLTSEQVKELVGNENFNEEKFNEYSIDGNIPASKLIELIENYKENNVNNNSNSRKNSNTNLSFNSKTKDKNDATIIIKDPKVLEAQTLVFKEYYELKSLKRKALSAARIAAREAIELARKQKEEEDRIAAEKLAEEMATVAVQKKDDDDENKDDDDDDEGDEDGSDDDDDSDDDDGDDGDDDGSQTKKKKKRRKKDKKEEEVIEEIIDPPNKLPPILEGVSIADEYKEFLSAKELVLKEAIEKYNNIALEKFKYSDDFIIQNFVDDFFYELDRSDRDPNDIMNMLHPECTLSISTKSLILKTKEVVAMGFANMFRGLNVKHEIVKVVIDKDPLPKYANQLNVKVNITIENDNPKLILELIDLVKPVTDEFPYLIANVKLINQDARPLYCLPEIAVPKTEYDNWEPQFKPPPIEPTTEELEAIAAKEEKKRLKKEKAAKKAAEALQEELNAADEEGDENEEGELEGDDVEGVEGVEGDAVEGDDVVDAVVEIGQNETE